MATFTKSARVGTSKKGTFSAGTKIRDLGATWTLHGHWALLGQYFGTTYMLLWHYLAYTLALLGLYFGTNFGKVSGTIIDNQKLPKKYQKVPERTRKYRKYQKLPDRIGKNDKVSKIPAKNDKK